MFMRKDRLLCESVRYCVNENECCMLGFERGTLFCESGTLLYESGKLLCERVH